MLTLFHFRIINRAMKFKDISEGAAALVTQLQIEMQLNQTWQVVGLGQLGLDVAHLVSKEFKLPCLEIQVSRTKDEHGFLTEPEFILPDNLGSKLLICDVGVETGKTAIGAAAKLAVLDHEAVACFAAIVIPREVQPRLKMSFDQIVAARTPLIRRDLRWEFEEIG